MMCWSLNATVVSIQMRSLRGVYRPPKSVFPARMAFLRSSAVVPSNVVYALPTIEGACESLPPVSALPQPLQSLFAMSFEYPSLWNELNTSIPSSFRSKVLLPRALQCALNGCGAMATPPMPCMTSMVSAADIPGLMSSVRKSPMTSPSDVPTSSPTTTSTLPGTLLASRPPLTVLWSVTQRTSSPFASAAFTMSAGSEIESGSLMNRTLESPEYFVWLCRSALPILSPGHAGLDKKHFLRPAGVVPGCRHRQGCPLENDWAVSSRSKDSPSICPRTTPMNPPSANSIRGITVRLRKNMTYMSGNTTRKS